MSILTFESLQCMYVAVYVIGSNLKKVSTLVIFIGTQSDRNVKRKRTCRPLVISGIQFNCENFKVFVSRESEGVGKNVI